MDEKLNKNTDENLNKKATKNIMTYIIIFFVGCLVMYAVVSFFPVAITEDVIKEVRDVTINDTGIAEAVAKVYDSVVVVSTYRDGTYIASGTGFVYRQEGDKYYLLTNYHVIEDGDNVTVTFTNGDVVETEIVGHDEYADIAVLSIESDTELTVAELGNNEESRVGDTAFAVGAPLDNAYSWTVTRGIISGKDRLVEVSVSNSNTNDYVMRVLQTDAAINSGNSGGPLCNANGEVIGITSLKLVSSGVEGMGFAIPIEAAVEKAEQIIDGEIIVYPVIGIQMVDFADAYYTYYSLIRNSGLENGVIVTSVERGSAADEAGIKANDIITAIDGEKVLNKAYLRYYLYQHSVGDDITITVYRDGNTRDLKLTLSADGQTA